MSAKRARIERTVRLMPTNHQKLEDPRPAGSVSRRSTGKYLPGLVASAVAVTVALIIHSFIPAIPAMTCAVILGILVANLPRIQSVTRGILRPGLNFSGKHLMRAGIVVLGLKLSIGDVVRLGWRTFGIVVAVVVLAFVGTFLLGKLFRLPGDSPLLIATGFSICGASAIGAMAAARRVRQEETVLPIALVTLCGTLAIGVLPLLITPLRLTRTGFGLWWGICARCGAGGCHCASCRHYCPDCRPNHQTHARSTACAHCLQCSHPQPPTSAFAGRRLGRWN